MNRLQLVWEACSNWDRCLARPRPRSLVCTSGGRHAPSGTTLRSSSGLGRPGLLCCWRRWA